MLNDIIAMTSLTYKRFLSHWHDYDSVVLLVDSSRSSELGEIYCIVIIKSTPD